MRKVITLIFTLCSLYKLNDWDDYKFILRQIKKAARKLQSIKKSKSDDDKKKDAQQQKKLNEYKKYIEIIQVCISNVLMTLDKFDTKDLVAMPLIAEIRMFLDFALLEMDQMHRRIVLGEIIPNNEKIFSVFEEHTEWINKGKAGVPVELGLKVCIIVDQFGFILHHRIMQNETDDQIAVRIVEETKNIFPNLRSCSFDKGFHSPINQKELANKLELVVLPKKGKLSEQDKEREYSEVFKEGRRQHAAVESAINCLEVHGLDRCPDRGLERFYSYIALGIVGRNLHQLGTIIRNTKRKKTTKESVVQVA